MLDSALHPVLSPFLGTWFCHQRGASDRSVSRFTGVVDTKVERLTVQVTGRDLPLDDRARFPWEWLLRQACPPHLSPFLLLPPIQSAPLLKLRHSALCCLPHQAYLKG